MADQFEEFRAYLPKYLSAPAQENLFAELSQFPTNINQRLYTDRLRAQRTIFQGDGLRELPVTNLPEDRIQNASRVIVVSNSCDVNIQNQRVLGPKLMYCPIISLVKYERAVRESGNNVPVNHFEDIKLQRISSLLYLPRYGDLDESVALLDHIVHYDVAALDIDEVVTSRVFSLSDYGFYLFVFKLSIHLTRIREGIGRT
jgi:hypothetical protein